MTREQAKELLPIIQAFVDGKTIEARTDSISKWIETTTPKFDLLHEYRIKPEPKYRPFKNAEECWQEMQKHKPFGWVKDISSIQSIIHINNDGIIANNGVANNYYTFKRSFNLKFTDDTPFGVEE